MIRYLLDSSTITLLEYSDNKVIEAAEQHKNDGVVVSTVTVEEALGGWYTCIRQAKTFHDQARASQSMAQTMMLLNKFPIIAVTESSLRHAESLVKAKLNIGRMDLKIAALALELDVTVVTNNIRDFSRVPGLKVEDWSA